MYDMTMACKNDASHHVKYKQNTKQEQVNKNKNGAGRQGCGGAILVSAKLEFWGKQSSRYTTYPLNSI